MLLALVALGLMGTRAETQERPPGGEGAPVGSATATAPAVVQSDSATATPNPLETLLLGTSARGQRDPFGTPKAFKDAADLAHPRFTPQIGVPIPRLSLRGYVELPGKPAVALIEVEGQGTYVVRAGDTIGLTFGGRTQVLRVQAVDASSARVEAGSFGQVLVVR